MTIKVIKEIFESALLFEINKFSDERGFFLELYSEKKYSSLKNNNFVQDNLSYSKKSVLRGLHFQTTNPQGKLIYSLNGEIMDVIVDIRQGSKTFGQYFAVNLSSKNNLQLWIPEGFAHGYCVLSDTATIIYKCTDFYNPNAEKTIIWNDSDINIQWPSAKFIISDKDKLGKKLKELF